MKFASEPPDGPSLAEQAAHRSTATLVAARAAEAQALLDAGAAVMVRLGLDRRATVAEIVREAGLSNQAFYRHFAGKDALVAALVDAGRRRLASYVVHRMAAERTPAGQVRAWIRAVLAQGTDPEVANATRAVSFNSMTLLGEADTSARQAQAIVWSVLEAPLAAGGSTAPAQDAYLIGQVVFGVLVDVLWAAEPADPTELARVEEFCLAATIGAGRRAAGTRRGPASR